MAATITAAISAEDYFKLSFPDREAELDHGIVTERTMPDYVHSFIQSRLAFLLSTLFQPHAKYSVCSELRMPVAVDIVRLLDLCVLDYRPAANTAPTQPPVVAIEIVSEDDRFSDILRKLREYHDWGVPHVWLIDPRSEQLAVYGSKGFTQVQALVLPEFNFSVTLKELLPPE